MTTRSSFSSRFSRQTIFLSLCVWKALISGRMHNVGPKILNYHTNWNISYFSRQGYRTRGPYVQEVPMYKRSLCTRGPYVQEVHMYKRYLCTRGPYVQKVPMYKRIHSNHYQQQGTSHSWFVSSSCVLISPVRPFPCRLTISETSVAASWGLRRLSLRSYKGTKHGKRLLVIQGVWTKGLISGSILWHCNRKNTCTWKKPSELLDIDTPFLRYSYAPENNIPRKIFLGLVSVDPVHNFCGFLSTGIPVAPR
jgi:hypothetical protein